MNILWFFLPGIIYLGIATSYTDIKYGKIKNRDVVIGICYAAAVYFSIMAYFFVKGTLNYPYVLEFFSNALFALAVAFGLWHYKVWSAGDGKLFFAFALLVPLEIYTYERYNWIPSLTLLFNIFIVGLAAMILLIIKNAKASNYRKAISSFFKDFFEPKKIIQTVLRLFAIFWLVQAALSFVGLGGNLLLQYVLAILIMSLLPNLTKLIFKKINYRLDVGIFVALAILRLVFDKSIYSLNFLLNFLILAFVWQLIRGILNQGLRSLGKDIFSKKISVAALKPGMILSDRFVRLKRLSGEKLKKIAKKEVQIISKGKYTYILWKSRQGKDYLGIESEGLTREQIKKIRNIGFKRLKISLTMPFAPLLFLAVIATLLVKGNILILLHFLF